MSDEAEVQYVKWVSLWAKAWQRIDFLVEVKNVQ